MYWITRHTTWPFDDEGEVLGTKKSYPEAKSFALDWPTPKNRITIWSDNEVAACWDQGVLDEPINCEVSPNYRGGV